MKEQFDAKIAGEILLEVRTILERHGVPFFLLLGTCLGAVRNGCILSRDKDIDIGVLFEKLHPKVTDLVNAFREAEFSVHVKYWPFYEARALIMNKNGIVVDIAGMMKKGKQRFVSSTRLDYALVYPAEAIEKTCAIQMLGHSWQVPDMKYLEMQYGVGWKIEDANWHARQSPARKRGYLPIKTLSLPIVCTIGCFDLLHVGHLDFLTAARAYGQSLIIGIPNDQLYCQLKGRSPIHTETHRAEMLRSLHLVDAVYILASFDYCLWAHDVGATVAVISTDHTAERFEKLSETMETIRLPRSPRDSSFDVACRCRQRQEA